MSRPEDERERHAFHELEAAVGRALERCRTLEARLRDAEERSAELEQLLRRFSIEGEAPEALAARAGRLNEENEGMRERLKVGREGVERLLARIRFLEEQR